MIPEEKKEACKTYIEQTKLLVTLASGFLVAPAGLVVILKNSSTVGVESHHLCLFLWSEILLVMSVIMGYIVLGTITGSQDDGSFNVFRPATRVFSIIQFIFYLAGIAIFIYLTLLLVDN